ncbi:NADP-dependent oxidoreductase domain-containing protein [Scleroderma citrinum]
MNALKPHIIYGTAWKVEHTTQLVISAFLQGFRAVDTACQPKHYREDLVGEALETLRTKHNLQREAYYVQTKFTPIGGQDPNKPLPYNPRDAIADQIKASLATSLRNLRTSYLDSYLLHSPFRTIDANLEAWRTLIVAQDAGTVRKIGISNVYDVRVLIALEKLRKVQVVQNRWYEGNNWDREVWRYCKDNDIEYQSFWTLSGSPGLMAYPAVPVAANKLDVTPAQIIFKLAQLHGIVPLTGTSSELHMQQDLAAERITFEGVEEEIKSITEFIWG